MKFSASINVYLAAIAVVPTFVATGVSGHGYIYEPPARNYVANTIGLTFGSQTAVPPKEYCPQCLNQNAGVCGITQDGTTDYDLWLDSAGQPMPFVSQRTYSPGQIIKVRNILTANHAGHAELRGCPIDGQNEATQECLDSYVFEFIADETYNMPKDPTYPERGYFFGGAGANGLDFSMQFRVPDNLLGSQVLLQWQYITANSCNPPGYANYFGGQNSQNKVLPDSLWSPVIGDCNFPYPTDGTTSAVAPERFWNCAEVTILDDGSPVSKPTEGVVVVPVNPPTAAPVAPTTAPVPAPVAPAPTPRPTSNLRPPTAAADAPPPSGGVMQCRAEWDSCFDDQNSCCDENFCEVFEFYARCRRRPDACLLEWNPCNDNRDACCEGLVCKGDGWLMCQIP